MTLSNDIVNFYIRAMEYGSIGATFVEYPNRPFIAVASSPVQLIEKKAIEKATNQSAVESLWSLFHFLVPSARFLTLALVGCLLYWLFSWLFTRFQKSARRKLPMKIASFFFVVFLFFLEELFYSTLSTESVLVKTDDLLSSKEQLLGTKKEFCFWERGTETDFFKNVSIQM